MNEKQIIKLLRNSQFSKLEFLLDDKLLEVNENYYGFLYFLLDKRRDDTTEVLKKIEMKSKGLSNAYEFLGRVATRVYSHIGEEHVALSFFRKSVELDERNSDAWWGIYLKSYDSNAFIKCLKIEFKNKRFHIIENMLTDFDFYSAGRNRCSKEDFKFLVKIVFDENLSCQDKCTNILIEAFYKLEQYEDGIKLIKSSCHVRIEVLQNYINEKLVDLNLSISKLYLFELEKLLKNDPKRIYKEYLKEAQKGKANPNKPILIMKAFKASKFLDVIKHYNEICNDVFYKHDIEPRLYYLMSQLYLKHEVDEKILNYVRDKNSNIFEENHGLLKAFNLKYCLSKLEKELENNRFKNSSIHHNSHYQDAEELLEDSDLIKHYLYDELYEEFGFLFDRWEELDSTFRLNSIFDNNESDISYEELIKLCCLWFDSNEYDEAINKISSFHNQNPATITSSNLLGVCFERKEMFIEAFEYYKQSLNLMLESKEYNYNIFSNYLNCAKKASFQIPDIKYDELRDRFNTSLVEEFKWGTFTSENLKRLYKYSPFNLNTLDSLSNQYFYLPSKNQLNDPVELPDLINVGPEQLIDSDYRICSFSNNDNAMLMWSHYTENHQGIMVEYAFGGELPTAVGIGKVKYRNEGKRNRDSDKYIFDQFLLTKNEEWAYEEEVRLISYKKNKIYYETYNYPNHDRDKINAWISCITLGLNFDESKKTLIINLIKNINLNRRDYEEKVKLKQATISKNNLFCLEYFDIDI